MGSIGSIGLNWVQLFLSTRVFVRVNDKIEWKFSIILFQNGESRGFATLIHLTATKFNIAITVFKTCRRKISILNTKYYESPFENVRVRKNDITITTVSKNNSNKSNNEYYNLGSIFEKFMLWIWICQKPSDVQKKSKHSISVFPIIRWRMSSEWFRSFPIGFVDSIQVCPTQ